MCGPGGTSDEPSGPPSVPVNIELERPRVESSARPRTAARPPTGTERPRTKHRSQTSSGDTRPKSHRRPESERRHRPESSSAGGRRSSHQPHNRDRTRRDIPTIQEHGHTEDKTIVRRLGELGTLIDQHVVNFYYPLLDSANSGISEDLDDPRTRHHALRRFIIQRLINDIVMVGSDSAPDTTNIAHDLSEDLEVYANSDNDRLDSLRSICKLGNKLRRDIENHPSPWEFGSTEEEGYIEVVPALLKDEIQVVAAQKFRI
ncbi:uncharacterized protein LY89DRAFT_7326 [Mollisia scopiformis]|uniref:Uncharacterized protein n=1 Tax=Mollisia scopiformis TaxID=149040 RepID=A0A194XUW4_MOLSC|nr:uncharacterized protein LY89DRAFT_7326 [Mollisia scopiformis]KUJ23926.1 hypothetical protein LY89DRAFT_7326 [Mollisia scopiformis]